MNRGRKEHEERAQRAAGERAMAEAIKRQGGMQIPVLREIVHHSFQVAPVQQNEDGSAVLVVMVHNGDALAFPLSKEAKERIGRELLAPSIETATVIPPELGGAPNGGKS
jgi:hypothetical protein